MPPVRHAPSSKPASKTTRTHEENQERAYVAASRRTDRSIDARMESARRASEIHYRRTGRALRITEEAVLNEEMYEEDDEDFAARIQRISAHFQDRNINGVGPRLASFLRSSVGARAQLIQQVIRNNQLASHAMHQSYPNAPSFVSPVLQAEMSQQHQQFQQRPQSFVQPYQQQQLPTLSLPPSAPAINPIVPVANRVDSSSDAPLTTSTDAPRTASSASQQAISPTVAPVVQEAVQESSNLPAQSEDSFGHQSLQLSTGAPHKYTTELTPLTAELPIETQRFVYPPQSLQDPYMPTYDSQVTYDFQDDMLFSPTQQFNDDFDTFTTGNFYSASDVNDGNDGYLAGTVFDTNLWSSDQASFNNTVG